MNTTNPLIRDLWAANRLTPEQYRKWRKEEDAWNQWMAEMDRQYWQMKAMLHHALAVM